MVHQNEKHNTVPCIEDRNSVDLKIIDDDPDRRRISVQCSACGGQFWIGKASLRNERLMARNFHCNNSSSSQPVPVSSNAQTRDNVPVRPRIIVPASGDGRRYLRECCKVDDVILEVHCLYAVDGTAMLYAKMIDKSTRLLGREVRNSNGGYPSVMYKTGSIDVLEDALRECKKQYNHARAHAKLMRRLHHEEDEKWRRRVSAFNLICNPSKCPSIEDCTSENLDMCIDLLIDDIPTGSGDPIVNADGTLLGHPPRPGTHLPSHFLKTSEKECIMDYYPPGSLGSPVELLPVLVDVVCKDRRSYRKECVWQLRSGEVFKSWIRIEDDTDIMVGLFGRIFPQLPYLLTRPMLSIAFYNDDPIPLPERVVPKVQTQSIPQLTNTSASCFLIEYKDDNKEKRQERPLHLFGLKAEETRMKPETHDGEEIQADLKHEILRDKGAECLELLEVVRPDDQFLTPETYAELNAKVEKLEELTTKLTAHVVEHVEGAIPRKLPKFDKASMEALNSYKECNSLQRSIVMMIARQGSVGQVPNFDEMGLNQLEEFWSKITE